MKSFSKKAQHLFCGSAGLLGLLLFFCGPADAHIEKGYMPDAIADMEYRILLEFQPDDTVTRNKLGMVLYRLERLDEAEGEFGQVLKIDPDNFNAMDALGLVRARQGKAEQAIKLFRAAIAIKADDSLVYYHLGQSLEQSNRAVEALANYRTATDLIKKELAASNDQDKNRILQAALDDIAARSGKISSRKPEAAK